MNSRRCIRNLQLSATLIMYVLFLSAALLAQSTTENRFTFNFGGGVFTGYRSDF
jgi:hypothetical protein